MSRVTRVDGPIGGFESGAEVEIEYDVPPDAWYFENNGAAVMPFAVLLEVARQPCGWLASYVGSALTSENDLSFRNLDGKGRVLRELGPDAGTVRTVSKLTNISQSGDMIIQSFDVSCHVGSDCVYELSTVFGFFPAIALANQVGLPTTDDQRADLVRTSEYFVDVTKQPGPYFGDGPRLAQPMLCMFDRVTSFEPDGGTAGLGRLRCEKDVDPGEWFFKAHFFQDPVQPGSLGIEVMLQLLQFYMLESGMAKAPARFEPIESGQEMSWKYRGQVVPENRTIATTLEITEKGEDSRGKFARGNASLWVDGKRIYEARGLGMRLVGT
jgi:3-hydroxymyristoyl/3-hydroxydecanoyl-(acyl carrier protein) dehydratase